MTVEAVIEEAETRDEEFRVRRGAVRLLSIPEPGCGTWVQSLQGDTGDIVC